MDRSENRISRRHFLRHGLIGFSVAATAPHFLSLTSRVFAADGVPGDDRVLVVLQFSGGQDGMSLVVPYGESQYYKVRSSIAHAAKDVLKLDDQVGFNPLLPKLHARFKNGCIAVVQGVSYPNPNRSHFKSMDIWHTADLRGRASPTGWVGRAIDACCANRTDPDLMVNVGSRIPYALRGVEHKPVSFDEPASYAWSGNPADKSEFKKLNGAAPSATDTVRWLHRVSVDAQDSSDKVRDAAEHYQAKADYPRGALGHDLRIVASLLAANLPTRVYYVSMGGFDTHFNERPRHDALMRQLDPALEAFFSDLKAQGLDKRVVMMCFSEFGRRVKENASGGTDHGVAGPMLVLGTPVKGGVQNRHPSLTDLDHGDLKMRSDFRSVYASILDNWMGIDSTKVLKQRFQTLPIL